MRTFWQVADTLSALGAVPFSSERSEALAECSSSSRPGVCGKMSSPGGRKVGSRGVNAGVSFPRLKTSSYTLLLPCPCGANAVA